jgi:hypothetical protein
MSNQPRSLVASALPPWEVAPQTKARAGIARVGRYKSAGGWTR